MKKPGTIELRHQKPITPKPGLIDLNLRSYIGVLLLGWTLAVALSLGWNLYQEHLTALTLTQQVARTDLGELRGGLMISEPLKPFLSGPRSHWLALVLGHSFLWFLGLVGIALIGLQIKKQVWAGQRAEAALQESSSKYRELVENANVIIMRVNLQGQVTFFNEYAQQFFGYQEAEIVGRPLVGVIIPETDADGRSLDALTGDICNQPENPLGFETQLQKIHGELSWVGWILKAVRDEGGEVREILWVGQDLTEHRQAEVAVNQANAELQSLVYEYGERNRQISLVNRMSELLQACFTLHEAYPIIALYCHELFGGCAGGLFAPRDSGKFLEAVAIWGENIAGEKEFPPGNCWALRTGRSYEGGSLEAGIECPHLATQPVDKYLCVPMLAQGETLGLLHLQIDASAHGEAGDFADISPELPHQLAIMVADHVALALGNLNLRETLKEQTIRDPLTGLFNRRYLTETLERELHQIKRRDGSLGFIMLDLDHFKKVNDTYGHEGGDALLKAIGTYLLHAVRVGDIVCRFGGEEFVLVLPGAPLEVTCERAAALQRGVKNLKVRHQGQVLSATVSVGVASYPEHGLTGENLLQAADAALYRAKQEGRDRVMHA